MKFVPCRCKHSSFFKTEAFYAVKSVRQYENPKKREKMYFVVKRKPVWILPILFLEIVTVMKARLNRFQPFWFSCLWTEDIAGSPSSWIILTILFLLLTFQQQLFFHSWPDLLFSVWLSASPYCFFCRIHPSSIAAWSAFRDSFSMI